MKPAPKQALPTLTFSERIDLHMNGEDISIIHPGVATTDGDCFAYFHRANVISVGDLPAALRYVAADASVSGNIDGQITAAELIINTGDSDTKIVVGHGAPVISKKDARDHLDMLVAVRKSVMNAIQSGKSLEEVVASKPTTPFDERHKGGPGPDSFVKGVYTDLARKAR